MTTTTKSKKSATKHEAPQSGVIYISGARMHNLKNVSVAIPKNKLVVVTGVSGSGKSSLTMDTLFAEGQRRYAESLSSYARQFLMRMDKPDVDYINGICPAIAIEQKVITRTPRSTVGSMTELQDYLRLLFARIGKTISPISGNEVKKDDVSDVVDYIIALEPGTKVQILIPFVTHNGRSTEEELKILLQKGFTRICKIDSNKRLELIYIEEIIEDATTIEAITQLRKGNQYCVLIDRIICTDTYEEETLHRIADSVQIAFFESEGTCSLTLDGSKRVKEQIITFNNRFEADGMLFEEPSPNFFSFNNPYGACPKCEGFGQILGIDLDLVIPDKTKSVYEDAVSCWKSDRQSEWKSNFIIKEGKKGFPIHRAIIDLSKEQWQILKSWINDYFAFVEGNLYKIQYRILQTRFRGRIVCDACEGSRLRKDALYVKINNTDIGTLSNLPISELNQWFQTLKLTEHEQKIAQRIILEINQRLQTLLDVGLSYLTLNRLANSLSGGESQRIQLTKFLGSNLTDSLYILDEPSIGLHPRDTARLIKVLKNLRDLNNTVVVVEHDDMMMQEADYIIDMGPLAAHLGGEVVATGNLQQLLHNENSLTAKYLSGKLKVEADNKAKIPKRLDFIELKNCYQHNLKHIDVAFPLNTLCVVTGVSGSGKTTLVKQTLYPALLRYFNLFGERPGLHSSLEGALHKLTSVEMIDQNPIGKSSRSNPVTYIKAYDEIRNLFASQKISKMRGFEAKHFSFNTEGGRCDTCKGEGEIVVSMQFLADVHLPCEECKGKRFKDEVLEVTYNENNIFDVLEMSVDEAILFFKDKKNVADKLQPLSDVGLGYIKLGQSSDTLSGGEAQRVKLASFLAKKNSNEHILFIFDEPTTGLHFHDINKLLHSFYALIDRGHSIIVVEHNTDIIRNAGWIIDIGKEGGDKGGELLFSGPPEELKSVKESYTAMYI